MSERLSPYSELADVLDVLPILLREARRARGLRMQDVAAQMRVSTSTICRVENGEGCRLDSAVAVLRWLDTHAPASEQTGGGNG